MNLNHFLSKNIFLPLGDIITGNSVYSKLLFLKKSQYWNHSEIEAYQNKKLQILINHAFENVSYYNKLFRKLNLSPQDIHNMDDLMKLPILTKQTIKKEGIDEFTSKAFSKKKLIKSSSSGSTGEPLFYYRTRDAYSMNLAASLRGWYWMDYNLGDRYMVLSQNSRKDPLKRIQDKLSNNLFLATNPLIDTNFQYILERIERFKPKIIRSYPDPLLFLTRYKQKHPEFKHSPHSIASTGNMLHDEVRKEIEETFNCKIFDAYSCEGNSNVFECPSHNCYHSTAEYGISEFIDDSGNIILNGTARLISTDLWNLAHPFIRYDTQDLVEVSDIPCSCGRSLPRINRIIGRDNDVLQITNGRKFIVHNFTGFFQVDHDKLNRSVEYFQVIQKKDGRFLFNLVVNSHFSLDSENYIRAYWENEFNAPVDVEIVKDIPLTASGKRKFIINLAN